MGIPTVWCWAGLKLRKHRFDSGIYYNLSIFNLFKTINCFSSAHCHCSVTEGNNVSHYQYNESYWRAVSRIKWMEGIKAGRLVQDKEEILVDTGGTFGLMGFAGTSAGRHPWTETFWPNESSPSQRVRGSPVRLAVNRASVSPSLRTLSAPRRTSGSKSQPDSILALSKWWK